MDYSFSGSDYGVFVWGREILRKNKTAHIDFEISSSGFATQELYWDAGFEKIVKQTRFGRVGIFYERKNVLAPLFVQKICSTKHSYTPQSKRSEKELSIKPYETQILWELANEGLGDSVEFRRLARKYIRKAKNEHRDSLFFLDAIMGEEKTKKILQHIAGTQIKLYFPSDFLETKETKNEKRVLKITGEGDLSFVQKRAQEILRTPLSKNDFTSFDI